MSRRSRDVRPPLWDVDMPSENLRGSLLVASEARQTAIVTVSLRMIHR